MATSILFTFSLCLCLCAVVVSSKSLAHDSGSKQSSNSADSVLKRTLKFDTVLGPKIESARDSEQVQSLVDSVPLPSFKNSIEGLRRARREVVTGNGCPGGMIWFMKKCRTFEAYERLVMDEEEK